MAYIKLTKQPNRYCLFYRKFKKIIQVLDKYPNIWILSDDIYEKLNFFVDKNINLINIDAKLKKRSLIVNGFSKGYCMTGWRLGYGAGPKILIDAMKKIQSQSTSAANTIAQNAAIKALELDHGYFEDIKTSLLKKRDCNFSFIRFEGV